VTLRGFIFTVVSTIWTAIECLAHSWLLLTKRPFLPYAIGYVRRQDFLHRHLLGLDYRIIGMLPRHGPVLIALQHQSAWETLKLHLLFDDPAVVLKQELLDIPLWGSFAARTRMIPIDRSAGSEAVPEMLAKARAAAAEGRPIVIFPQGTRVAVGEQKPYRSGVVKIAQATGLPIIPVALNSGKFWPKKLFGQRSGTVTLQVLPSIPATLPPKEMLAELARSLDEAGAALAVAP
jgi:1-acyl-sn-glycerol-3-phosphate acyltransferase